MLRAAAFGWLALAEPPTNATPPPTEVAARDEVRAAEAWDKGAKAFAAGDMITAIEQFEITYRLSGRSGPLFSLGQAHRHLWEKTQDDKQRRRAIQLYEEYLKVDPEGRRKIEAQKWILELQSELEDMGEPPPVFTRIGITSTTPGARASIDGAAPVDLPTTPDLEPGLHTVEVSANGFHPQRREVELPEGSTLSLPFALEPREALLTVRGPAGAMLYVDGQRAGRLPLASAVALLPGTHQIGVAQRGRTLFVRELDLERASRRSIDARTERTGQRKVAIASVAVGSTAAVASSVLMALAFVEQHRARGIADEREAGSITAARYQEERDAIGRRDGLRSAAIATGVSGLVLAAAGALLWITDDPPVASQLHRPATKGRRAARPARDLAFTPTLGIGRQGASAGLRGAF